MPGSDIPAHPPAFPKSVERTVFVRFRPASSSIRRHHLEDLFSQVGPIKKTSVVHAAKSEKASSYGFVKYSTEQDAKTAAKELNRKTITVDGKPIQVIVEAASASRSDSKNDNESRPTRHDTGAATAATAAERAGAAAISLFPPAHRQSNADRHDVPLQNSKNQTRLILRNVGFSTTEEHIRKYVTSKFGPVSEVHLPPVPNSKGPQSKSGVDSKTNIKYTHRGFAFVTFQRADHAAACVSASSLPIGNRDVTVAHTRNKTLYEQEKERKGKAKGDGSDKKRAVGSNIAPATEKVDVAPEKGSDKLSSKIDENGDDDDDDGDESSAEDPDSENESDEKGVNGVEGGDDDDDHDDDADPGGEVERKLKRDEAIAERRVVFLRNLPFDTARHDVFELIRTFGRVESIHLVKKAGGLFQGSCFVHFASRKAAERLVDAHGHDPAKFTPQQAVHAGDDRPNSLQLRGRSVLVDWAVDKETAAAVVTDRGSGGAGRGEGSAKDRRNLYLKGEGRVDDEALWQALPLTDQQKRQRAWSDKLTKLKSPLFFINPTRLSIRNMAKSVDEKAFKQMCVQATQRGLERKLVSVEDLLLHWKAKGDMSHREILAKVQEAEESGADLLPAFEGNNVKRSIPSVFIDRDFSGSKAGGEAPSRGFGFVEFTHHVHALACLRELNNNPYYAQYVAGGTVPTAKKHKKKDKRQKGDEEAAKSPRLIVEFTVENAAKAKQQAIHRAQQETNQKKQTKVKRPHETTERKAKSRGALQRERKRKAQEGAETEAVSQSEPRGTNAQVKEPREPSSSMHPGQPTSETDTAASIRPPKPVKPAKKRKVDPEEVKFNDLVESYKRSFSSGTGGDARVPPPSRDVSKRWYDDE